MLRPAVKQGLLGLAVAAALSPAYAQQEEAKDPFIQGLDEGKLIADVRVRYEQVDDSVNDDAKAFTVRTRLGYQTGSMAGFVVLGEFTNTTALFGMTNYSPENAGFATVADPVGTDLNRLSVSYIGFDNMNLALGRQRINLDNQRWVGNVGWRQKEQTFDSASFDYVIGEDLSISYDYIAKVKGVTEALDHDARHHIANVGYSGWDVGTLTGYTYLLNDTDAKFTNNTVGARFSGDVESGELTWLYSAELARQHFNPSGGSSARVNYLSLEGGIDWDIFEFKVGYEQLGSDGGDYGLQTPLATKHKFNGWADKFLSTPEDGLRDTYAGVFATLAGIRFGGYVHDFRADSGGDKYGRELDLVGSKTFLKHYTVGAKYASYRGSSDRTGAIGDDTRKFWLWFNFNY